MWAWALAAVLAVGCASTQYPTEGSGQPTDRASGAVPAGALGACRRPNTKRPPIVSQALWDGVKPCDARTPVSFVRLGYGHDSPDDPEADKQMEKLLGSLRDAQKPETGNGQFLAMLRALRPLALVDPMLKDRVAKDASRTNACDFTYLLNNMAAERAKLEADRPCTAEAFNPKQKSEVCLFDTARAEGTWLTSSWDCVTHTDSSGSTAQSCHRLCAYDDYCARQVSCAAPDLDLLLCALGVCLPEPRAGFYGR